MLVWAFMFFSLCMQAVMALGDCVDAQAGVRHH